MRKQKIEKNVLKFVLLSPSRWEVLIEKLWYLSDQTVAGTTDQAAHQTGATAPVTDQKDHPLQEGIPTGILTGRTKINQKILAANVQATGVHHL
jgi:hypothetical protein